MTLPRQITPSDINPPAGMKPYKGVFGGYNGIVDGPVPWRQAAGVLVTEGIRKGEWCGISASRFNPHYDIPGMINADMNPNVVNNWTIFSTLVTP